MLCEHNLVPGKATFGSNFMAKVNDNNVQFLTKLQVLDLVYNKTYLFHIQGVVRLLATILDL